MTKPIEKWLEERFDRYDKDALIAKRIEEFGSPMHIVEAKYRRVEQRMGCNGGDIISAECLLNSVDDVSRVSDFLEAEVGDNYIDEEKLRVKMEVSKTKWDRLKNLSVFEGRRLSVEQKGKRVTLWSSAAGIQALKDHISMAKYEVI